MMSFSSSIAAVTASSSPMSPMNLTSMAKLDMANIKTEADDLNGHTAIKRHTIDAILGLPRLGFHPDLALDQRGLNNGVINRSSLSESDAELGDKDKHSLLDGMVIN